MPDTWTGAGDEAALRLLATRVPAILWSTDRDLRVTTCTGSPLLGLRKKGSGFTRLTIPLCFGIEETGGVSEAAQRRALEGVPVNYDVEWSGRWFRCHVAPLLDARGDISGVVGAAVEITESRRLEAELIQSQKMECIGRLAGGIAHDFNNLLTSVLGYAELALLKLDQDPPPRHEIESIRDSGLRAAELTRQLLAFSRKQVTQPRILDLNSIVERFSPILRRTIGEDVELRLDLSPELACVRADRGQLEQILMNLVVNSRDAMPTGGIVTIRTANCEATEEEARVRPGLKPGAFVGLSVVDTGVGMDAATQTHLFEPFFTTKELGRGTGLGLSTVYGIVKQSGGYIDVASSPGRGSRFEVLLPQVDAPADLNSSTTIPSIRDPKGVETVLLVEDEQCLLLLAGRILTGGGYTVLTARDGVEALEVCRKHSGSIHLLLTDVVMPRMGGAELAREVRSLRPPCKVLFMSGYSGDHIASHGVLGPEVMLLEKPFTADALSAKVRKALDCPA